MDEGTGGRANTEGGNRTDTENRVKDGEGEEKWGRKGCRKRWVGRKSVLVEQAMRNSHSQLFFFPYRSNTSFRRLISRYVLGVRETALLCSGSVFFIDERGNKRVAVQRSLYCQGAFVAREFRFERSLDAASLSARHLQLFGDLGPLLFAREPLARARIEAENKVTSFSRQIIFDVE